MINTVPVIRKTEVWKTKVRTGELICSSPGYLSLQPVHLQETKAGCLLEGCSEFKVLPKGIKSHWNVAERE